MSRLVRLVTVLTVTALFAALSGCASSGRQFDATHVNEVQTGVQDKATVLAWFGEPSQTSAVTGHPGGCIERWIWTYAHAVGFGQVTESHTLVVDFDSKGIVCDHAYTKLE